jgi:hypothetical protein
MVGNTSNDNVRGIHISNDRCEVRMDAREDFFIKEWTPVLGAEYQVGVKPCE